MKNSPVRNRRFRPHVILTAGALTCAAAPLSAQLRPGADAHRRTETITIRTTEGTALAFDLTPDGRTIIFDLLGQLWSLPAQGGDAVALTDAAREVADDSDPSVSPDGAWIVLRSDRPQGRGLWLRSLINGRLRELTDSTYFVNNEHVAASWAPDSKRIAYLAHWRVHVRNVVTNEETELQPAGLPRFLSHLTWSPDGKRILAVAGYCGQPWEIDLATNRATPVDSVTKDMKAPRYSPDGSRIAYFAVCDSANVIRLRVAARGDTGRVVAEGRDLNPQRVRWSPDGCWLYYSADGKLWRVSSEGGSPVQIPFTATLTFARAQYRRRPVTIPLPGQTINARGFTGLALAPDARRYAIIALGKLWIADVGGTPRAIRATPSTAYGLSWSPDGKRVVWSAGPGGTENLFVTQVTSGETHQVTALPGSESLASWSPDGRLIAFVHWKKPASSDPPWAPDTVGLHIRVIDANRNAPATLSDARDLGSYYGAWLGDDYAHYIGVATRLNWNATSSAVFTFTTQSWPIANGDSATGVWVGLDGSKHPLNTLPYRPSFLHVARNGSLTYVEDGLLHEMSPNSNKTRNLGDAPALYPSVADDGTVLFASDDGLRIRRPGGTERHLGWPIGLHVAAAPAPILIRNARIFDGSRALSIGTRDILIEGGRIRRIAAAHEIRARPDVTELDASGRTIIPGLIDSHIHLMDPAILRAALYFGVTTVRDMGGRLAPVAAQRDAVLAGAEQGARVVVSGPMFYPSPTTGGLTGDVEWMPRDSATMQRGLRLLRSFGGEHVKMRFPLTFASGAMFVRIARGTGFTVSGHCANPLSLVAAGIDGQEHLDGQCDNRGAAIGHDDRIQLYRGAGLYGVSTSYLHGAHARASRDTSMAHDPEIAPFLSPRLRLRMLSDDPSGRSAFFRTRQGDDARIGALRLHQAHLPIVLGSDDPGFPDGLHGELAEVVTAGLTPSEALVAATSTAARVLGIDGDVGTIAVGKIADLVLLDADPLIDIRNTRRIWHVIQGGRIVDRAALRAAAMQGN